MDTSDDSADNKLYVSASTKASDGVGVLMNKRGEHGELMPYYRW